MCMPLLTNIHTPGICSHRSYCGDRRGAHHAVRLLALVQAQQGQARLVHVLLVVLLDRSLWRFVPHATQAQGTAKGKVRYNGALD